MILLGVTGGIGMGKSACAGLLGARGFPVVDTDDLARRVVERGTPALEQIRQVFGPDLIGPDGTLRRDELGKRVFSDPTARKQLEEIVHPRVRQLWRAQARQWRVESRQFGAVIIPLLFETRAEAELDATLCIACSNRTQRERLLARGWSAGEIERRNQAQLPIEEKMARANYVIWAEAGLDLHEEQLRRVLAVLLKQGGWPEPSKNKNPATGAGF